MVVGTIFLGKVKEINKQWIETKFFILGIPLFPTSSMLVTSAGYKSRQGIVIPLDSASVIAGYTRIFTFLAFIGFLFAGIADRDVTFLLIGLACGATWFYFYFKFGKATQSEIEERSKLGKAIGIYALPNWYDFDGALNNFKHLEFYYKDKFPNSDWKADLAAQNVSSDRSPLLYALALFNYMVDQSGENEKLLNKARLHYK